MGFVRYVYALCAGGAVLGIFALPLLVPTPISLRNTNLTAAPGDIVDGYPVPMSFEEAGLDPADYPDYVDTGGMKDAGYGGSLKDGYAGDYYDDSYAGTYYDEPAPLYQNYGFQYDEPSYGYETGGYVAQGLSYVPLVLANVLAPQQRTYSYQTYSTTYVPSTQQVRTYAVPQQQYQIQQVPFQESGQIQALSGAYTPQPQIVTTQQPVNIVQPTAGQQVVNTSVMQNTAVAQITGTVSNIAVAQPVAVPAQTTRAEFFAVPQQVARPVQTTNVHLTQTGAVTERVGIAPEGAVKPVCSIQAKPTRIAAGGTTVISWSGANADTATLVPIGTVALVGSSTVKIATTTVFTLKLDGAAGKSECSVTVSIDPSMCLPGCPPGFVCTPVVATTTPAEPKKSGFWSWLGF